ncbi:hypothetical protein FZ025_08635 [Xanthomonas hyacinthi]|uniref:Uncharacterized protein n=1 Tax=Xanthomonas hyacinthi TaxID=56455 RepID=A0A2S7EYK3_9XANT|nr:hypothetical protein [Xanthomonas hyacinthi]KLD76833.1 hypothetical protein Y886_19155 [Xanthomonas hyacinthi DSM 19077]PPU98233.1 hypothetical protein XhyaCFBP1156_08505 [Xanthomonas hyacinthi]QGY76713.1 hypothetical protein FZ025_08635 [Xanthomonas hyacinthi]
MGERYRLDDLRIDVARQRVERDGVAQAALDEALGRGTDDVTLKKCEAPQDQWLGPRVALPASARIAFPGDPGYRVRPGAIGAAR